MTQDGAGEVEARAGSRGTGNRSLPLLTAQLMKACLEVQNGGQGTVKASCSVPSPILPSASLHGASSCQLGSLSARGAFLLRYMSHPGTIKTALLWQNVLCCMFVLWCLSVTPVVSETPVICWSLTAITCSKSLAATQPTWWDTPFLSLSSPEH